MAKRILKKGSVNRRVIFESNKNGSSITYHATKGWRHRKDYEVAKTKAGDLYSSFLA